MGSEMCIRDRPQPDGPTKTKNSFSLIEIFTLSAATVPSSKITALAGESATGKTYFLCGIIKNFLDANPDSGVVYFESESAITKQMIIDRGIDPSRMVILPVTTVQEFRTQSLKVLDSYINQEESIRRPLFLALDSLGMLSTTKAVSYTHLTLPTNTTV